MPESELQHEVQNRCRPEDFDFDIEPPRVFSTTEFQVKIGLSHQEVDVFRASPLLCATNHNALHYDPLLDEQHSGKPHLVAGKTRDTDRSKPIDPTQKARLIRRFWCSLAK
jgi:hypothetical protein